ncbi:ParA family protein (plasmid) [Leptospira interrogans]|uniref:ParA family protein n=2 Tax=Leptospira interrogans TaxID=173 RepID=UPI0002BA9E97|nr:ParA family protein [Leptospira interrogans]EMN60338.1 CobQ/CobB/MinD/ParA nucleotide binding domain protein [Leptospira interrogans serovar Pyrogenes str. R168]MBE0302223.1 ParA family protein [Leptospira interrogans serovar Yeoncheon]QOI36772.1 ParA family protein [Leptospira interrogans serovar Icterohaemorrhagiae]ULG90714.1 ParA family protein [Leptospira interrogans]UML78442.1 ParA family protein [Leptospira interrogans]
MLIYATASLKGGVGKTTDAIFVAQAYVVINGFKVLLIDLDPNNNLTDYYLRNDSVENINSRNIGHVLEGSLSLSDVIRKTEFGIDIVPANIRLARIARDVSSDPSAILRFQSALKKLDYDLVILDTPPYLSFTLTLGIYVADKILVPVSLNRWSLQGHDEVYAEIERITQDNPKPILNIPSKISKADAGKATYLEKYTFTKSFIQNLKEVEMAAMNGVPLNKDGASWKQFSELAKEIL